MKPNYTKGMCFLSFLFFFGIQVFSQTMSSTEPASETKTIIVTLIDGDTKEAIPFAYVVAYNLSGVQLTVSTTNMDGVTKFVLKSLDDYILKAVYVGYPATIDTISCKLPRCQRAITMELKQNETLIRGFCCCSTVCYQVVETEEELEEAERQFERVKEEVDILVDINDFVCFPNPAKDILNIKINGAKINELKVMDVNGATIIQKEVDPENHLFEFNLNQLAQGIYYVVTYGEGHASSTKTIIKN